MAIQPLTTSYSTGLMTRGMEDFKVAEHNLWIVKKKGSQKEIQRKDGSQVSAVRHQAPGKACRLFWIIKRNPSTWHMLTTLWWVN